MLFKRTTTLRALHTSCLMYHQSGLFCVCQRSCNGLPVGSCLFLVLDLFDQPVKVTFKQPVLNNAVLFEFAFRMGLGKLRRNPALVFEDLPFVKFQKHVQPFGPIFHRHGDFPAGTVFGKVQVGVDDAIVRNSHRREKSRFPDVFCPARIL